MSPARQLDWQRDGRDWPLRESSRFVDAGLVRWHVQVLGRGPVALLVHGAGAASFSWRGLAPLLARHFTLVIPDLPGHGFTASLPPAQQSLAGMAAALLGLLRELDAEPVIGVGHSAGAALLVRAALDRGLGAVHLLVGINAALLPFAGVAGLVLPLMARLFAHSSLLPRFFAWRAADRRAVERLIASTGSIIDALGVELYARLVANPGHVAGALAMMANWDLQALVRGLPELDIPLLLLAGSRDRTVDPNAAHEVARSAPKARVSVLPDLGHLAHEEAPRIVAAQLLCAARAYGCLAGSQSMSG